MYILLGRRDGPLSDERVLSFGIQKPEWSVGINLPKFAQAAYDVLDFWSLILPLVPALLNEFPRR